MTPRILFLATGWITGSETGNTKKVPGLRFRMEVGDSLIETC